MPSDKTRTLALICAMLVPLGLLHAWVVAEGLMAATDLLFLFEMARTRKTAWAKQPWFIAAMLWWLWLLFCSTPLFFTTAGWSMAFVQALVIFRFIIFTAALQNWLLTTPKARRTAWLILALSCLWIGLESWQQYFTGRNIFGYPRWGDGALTGPFWKPRAGQLYAHLLFIALLPPALAMFTRPGKFWRTAAGALAILAVVTSVLIGQRMGLSLTALGLITAALLFPQLRKPAAIALIAGLAVLALTPFIAPPTYAKLVGETSRNLSDFAQSPYGEIFTRATVMGLASPWHGWGFNGYRGLCTWPEFNVGIPALHLAPATLALFACGEHPQNYYIQAFSDAGYPGLILFTALMLIWLRNLSAGLWRQPDPLRAGLFIGFLTFAWPFASTDEFPIMYMLGWFFFILGLGLAPAHITPNNQATDPKHG